MPKVLIVGSADLGTDLERTILWADGVERALVSTPGGALEVARAFVPSVVVVEGTDAPAAIGLLLRLRENAGTRRSSIVVVSRQAVPPEEELRQAGANLVLTGPVDPPFWNARLGELFVVPRRVRTRLLVRAVPRNDAGAGEPILAVARDLSVGGMLLETKASLAPGTILDLSFTLPGGDGDGEAKAVGSVVRTGRESPASTGIRFLSFEGNVRERLHAALAAVPPERTFGRYEELAVVGEGSMGRVYRAFDPLARRVVAVKTLRPEHVSGPEAGEYLLRFRREAQAAARLVHANIVTIFDVGDDYFAMELLEGATLQAILRKQGKLALDEALRILVPVAAAMDYAHSKGTIHRDIKPANLFVVADGTPKVMDFGVAHLTSAVITASGQVFGTPAYMAPEQITKGEVSVATDVFSLAVVAYEALTGRKPFEGETITPILYGVVNTDPPPPSTWNPDLPRPYDDVFRHALAKDPAARFRSAGAFVAALGPNAPGVPATDTRPATAALPVPGPEHIETLDLKQPSPWTARRWPRRRSVVAVVLAAVVGLAATALALRSSRERVTALPPPPGLEIATQPTDTTVFVDGVKMGNAPLFLTPVPRGFHHVKVTREGFVPSELSLEVTGEGPPIPLRFTLQPATGTLRIDSEPSRASVKVDGRDVGTTPVVALAVTPGGHEVRVESAGFRTWVRRVNASLGETLQVTAQLGRIDDPTARKEALRTGGWVQRGDLVELGAGVTAPRKVSGDPALSPDAARRLRLRGTVTVEMTVTESGKVADPRVVESAGEILDQALLDAVRHWRYEPADLNGLKVRVRIRESQAFGATGG
jgi:eukaryotic-like serine/threonine-protein kinase